VLGGQNYGEILIMVGGLIWAEILKLFLVRDVREILDAKWVWISTGHSFYDQGGFNKTVQNILFVPRREKGPSPLLIQIKWEVFFWRVFALDCEDEKK
jgi:hypothetical protein